MLKSLAIILLLTATPAMAVNVFTHLDPETTSFELATSGRGEGIHALGGHLFIRVINQSRNVDLVMQWGIFDLSDPDFIYSYINGDMKFRSGVSDTARQFDAYRLYENRSVWVAPLNLTIKQKAYLLEKFSWWLEPENRTYRYNLWYNNCATVVRDLLFGAIGPRFKEHFERPMGESFRTLGEEYFLNYPAIPYLADTFFNSSIDQPIQRWDAWLLPVMAQDLLADVPAFDDDGNPIPGQKLLGERQTVYQGVVIKRPLLRNGWAIPLFYLVLAAGIFGLRKSSQLGRACGVAFILFGIHGAIIGLLLIAAWALTGHEVTHGNANLLFYSPLDILFLLGGVPLIWGRAWPLGITICRYLLIGHGGLFIVGMVAWMVGIIEQDISVTFKYWLPSTLGIGWLYWTLQSASSSAVLSHPKHATKNGSNKSSQDKSKSA